MSIYRKNARKDMIIELEEDEIKFACMQLIRDRYFDYYVDSKDINFVITKKDSQPAEQDNYNLVVRIKGPEILE